MNTTNYYNYTNYNENISDKYHGEILLIIGIFAFLSCVFFCITRISYSIDDPYSVNRQKAQLHFKNDKLFISV